MKTVSFDSSSRHHSCSVLVYELLHENKARWVVNMDQVNKQNDPIISLGKTFLIYSVWKFRDIVSDHTKIQI